MRPMVAVTTSMRVLDTYLGRESGLHALLDFYARALDRAGATQLLVGQMHPDDARRVLDRVDGLVVTGGRDLDPALYGQENTASVGIYEGDDARDIALVLEAYRRKMPVLAICRGLQAVNVALGGELHQHVLSDSDPEHPTLADQAEARNAHRHTIRFEKGCRLTTVYRRTTRKVNSLHHQAISRPAPGLDVVARTPGGAIEAVESADPTWPLLAVQWHPEMLGADEESGLFEAFVEDALAYRKRYDSGSSWPGPGRRDRRRPPTVQSAARGKFFAKALD